MHNCKKGQFHLSLINILKNKQNKSSKIGRRRKVRKESGMSKIKFKLMFSYLIFVG
jgi:hypothetical protein